MAYICINLSFLGFLKFVFLLVLSVVFKKRQNVLPCPWANCMAQLMSPQLNLFPVQVCPILFMPKAIFPIKLGKKPTSSSFRSSLTWTSLNGLVVCLCCKMVKPLKTHLNWALPALKLHWNVCNLLMTTVSCFGNISYYQCCQWRWL